MSRIIINNRSNLPDKRAMALVMGWMISGAEIPKLGARIESGGVMFYYFIGIGTIFSICGYPDVAMASLAVASIFYAKDEIIKEIRKKTNPQ